MANIGDNTIFSPSVFSPGILGRDNVFGTYIMDDRNGTGLLEQPFGTGASAAYSLYDLGNQRGSVTETGETVYGDFEDYASDFSAGVDSWSAVAASVDGNIDGVGGENDTLRSTMDTTTATHNARRTSSFTVGNQYRVTGKFYIPSSNTQVDGVRILDAAGGIDSEDFYSPSLDTWVDFDVSGTASNAIFIVRGTDGGSNSFLGNGTDVWYVKDVTITELDTYRTQDVTYHNPVVRLRRDSDGIHKSFSGVEIGNNTALGWVNEDVVTYTSDFSAGVDGWTAGAGAVAGNIDSIGGRDDNLRFTIDNTSSAAHRARKTNSLTVGLDYLITGDVYIPSTNDVVDGFRVLDGAAGINQSYVQPGTDAWIAFSVSGTSASANLEVRPLDGSGTTVEDPAGDDVFYIRNVSITQLTSNAYATTWYDQSGVSVTSTNPQEGVSVEASLYGWTSFTGTTDGFTATSDGSSRAFIDNDIQAHLGGAIQIEFDVNDIGAGVATMFLIDSPASRDGSGNVNSGEEIFSMSGDVTTPDDYRVEINGSGHVIVRYNLANFTSLVNDELLIRFANNNSGEALDISNLVVSILDKAHNDATQTTADSQPKVVNAGALTVDANGNYALDFDGTDDYLSNTGDWGISGSGTRTVFAVIDRVQVGGNTGNIILGIGDGDLSTEDPSVKWDISQEYAIRVWGGNEVYNGGSINTTELIALTFPTGSDSAADHTFHLDGSEVTAVSAGDSAINTTSTIQNVGRTGSNATPAGGTGYAYGSMSAVLVYASDKSTDRSAIEESLSDTITTALS